MSDLKAGVHSIDYDLIRDPAGAFWLVITVDGEAHTKLGPFSLASEAMFARQEIIRMTQEAKNSLVGMYTRIMLGVEANPDTGDFWITRHMDGALMSPIGPYPTREAAHEAMPIEAQKLAASANTATDTTQ